MTLKFFSTIFFSFCIYIKLLFMLSISSKSHLITHSGVGCVGTRPFKVLGEYPGSRALGGHLGTWALRHLGHSGAWALKAIRNLAAQELGLLRHLDTWTLRHSRTRALEALYLADSPFLCVTAKHRDRLAINRTCLFSGGIWDETEQEKIAFKPDIVNKY